MSRWSDLATWVGPTPNQGGAMREQRGVVVHIAEGYYAGTIAWQRNDSSNVSSHFIVAKDGRIAQMVDTDVTAWTQSAGNGKWLSIENEGFTPNALTPEQVEANAKLLARGHQVYGYPLQIATNPDGKGLGHHSMGCNWPAGAWGHCDCPGDAIIAQKQQILDRAIAIVKGGGSMATSQGDHNIGYVTQNGLFGVEHPDAHIPAEGGFVAGVWPSPFAEVLKAMLECRDANLPKFANLPARTWINGTAKELAEIKAALAELAAPVVEVDYVKLAAAMRPIVAAECELAVRRVMGGLDGATPDEQP